MACRNGWNEEEVVDYVLDRLPVEKRKAFERHLKSCTGCEESVQDWKAVLGEGAEAELEPTGPSPRVRHQLMRKIKQKTRRPRLRTKMPRRSAVAFIAAACALVFFVFGTELYPAPPKAGDIQPINGKALVTARNGHDDLHYVRLNTRNVNGYVWQNGSTHELMLFLNGVPEIDGKDYQAWLVAPHKRADAGLLQVNEGMARLYYHGPQMENVRNIVVSVEPRGGSEFQTGPGKFLIPLSR